MTVEANIQKFLEGELEVLDFQDIYTGEGDGTVNGAYSTTDGHPVSIIFWPKKEDLTESSDSL